MSVACGGCLGCRLDRARAWSIRMVHEAQMWDDNCFVTLTYDEEHMPRLWTGGPGTLVKEHFQKSMKRLRKRFPNRQIRYYQCREYGDNLDRPHYHACFFNLDFPDKELLHENEGNFLFVSKTLSELWPYGFTTIGEFSLESAGYVARYCLKKVGGNMAQDHYLRCDDYGVAYWLEPEYNTMSRGSTCKEHKGMPYQVDCPKCSRGIGRDWYEKYKGDVFPSDEVPVPGSGVHKKAPRYYEGLYEKYDETDWEMVKELRKQFYKAHKEEYTPERLMAKYNVKKAQIKSLKRDL